MDELIDEKKAEQELNKEDIEELNDLARNPEAEEEPETQEIEDKLPAEIYDEERQEKDDEPVMTAAEEIEAREKENLLGKAEINIVEPNLQKDGEEQETEEDKSIQVLGKTKKDAKVYDLEYIEKIVKYVETERCPEEKVILKFFEKEPEEYPKLLSTMEREHIYLYSRYMTYVKPALPKNKDDLKDKLEYDEVTDRAIIAGTDINFYMQDFIDTMEEKGEISFTHEQKAQRAREKSGNALTIDKELLGRGTSAEEVINQVIFQGVNIDYALRMAGVLKDGDTMYNDKRKTDFINYIRRALPEKYEQFISRQGNSEFRIISDKNIVKFVTQKDFAKPDSQDMDMNALLEAMVEKTDIKENNVRQRVFKPRELSLRQVEAFLLSEKSLNELAEAQGLHVEELREMLEEQKVKIREEAIEIEAKEGKETKESKAMKDTANGIELMQDSELEWEATTILYEFVKQGGIMEEKLKERNLSGPFTLTQACSIIPAYAGLPCSSGKIVSKDVADLMSKGSTVQNKIFTKVLHLNEIQGPNGEKKEGNVHISPMMDAKEQEKSQSNAKESILDAFGPPLDTEKLFGELKI